MSTNTNKRLGFTRSFCVLLLAIGVGACTSADRGVDPYEQTNRKIYDANVQIDRVAIRPVSKAYGVVPDRVRTSVSNFGNNLDQPRSVINDVLQGEAEDAVHNTFRFLLNSTLGIGGLFDFAAALGLEDRETGFADTLSVWGVRPGAYQVLPILGPSTERDTAGFAVDIILNPLDLFISDDVARVSNQAAALGVLNDRVVFGTTFDNIYYESADGYEQLKLFYLDSRRFELGEETPDEEIFDPFEELEN